MTIKLDKDLFLTKHAAIYDPKFQERLYNAPWKEWLGQSGYFDVKDEYLTDIHNWIHSSTELKIKNLDRFKYKDLIHGTTQAFDEAYYRYKERRLRTYRGEYAYHKRIQHRVFIDNKDGSYVPIEKNDWVIISLPFCGNGYQPPFLQELLNDCTKLDVPVLIDCAWFGTHSFDFDKSLWEINIDYPCIKEVCFSLSKGLGLGNMRSGIRYSNYDDNLPIRQQNDYNHLPLGLAQIGIWQMKEFTPDYIGNKYFRMRQLICATNDIRITPVMHIGLLDKDHPDYEHYLIDDVYSKVGIREAIKLHRKTHKDSVFCKAPFTSLYVDKNSDELAFCCMQTDRYTISKGDTIQSFWNSSYAKDYRKKFIDGEWPTGCYICQEAEKKSGSSSIFSHTYMPLKSIDVESGNEVQKPRYIDYRPDNLCNLMCTMCGPVSSNLIQKMWKELNLLNEDIKPTTTLRDSISNSDLTKELVNKDTLQLKVIGGEPTINSHIHSVLQYAVDNGYAEHIDLRITTNFTNINKTFEIFDKFKSCDIEASVDATGPTYEYIRRPAKWSAVKSNILKFADRYNKDDSKVSFGLSCVWQLANCFTVKDWLPELFELVYGNENIKKLFRRDKGISMLECTTVKQVGVTLLAVPMEMRQSIVNDLNEILKDWKNNPFAKRDIEKLIWYTEKTKFSFGELKKFQTQFPRIDEYKKTDIKTLSTKFEELLKYE